MPDYPPKVLKQLEDIVANVGDLLCRLECAIGGSPPPAINWCVILFTFAFIIYLREEIQNFRYKDGSPIKAGAKYDMNYKNGAASLTLKK